MRMLGDKTSHTTGNEPTPNRWFTGESSDILPIYFTSFHRWLRNSDETTLDN